MKLIFAGTPDFAAAALQALLDAGAKHVIATQEEDLVAEVAAITEAAMRGEITDFKDSLRRRVALLKGVPEAALHEVFAQRHFGTSWQALFPPRPITHVSPERTPVVSMKVASDP